MELLRALEGALGVVAIGHRLPYRCDLIVRRHLTAGVAAEAKLRFDLPELALGPLERQLQFLWFDTHEQIAGADLGAELNRYLLHPPCHFAADPRHVGGEQRAGEVDLTLNRDPLHIRRLDGNGASASAPPAGAGSALAGRPVARGRQSHEQEQGNGR